jgi:hypothetical protein
MQNGKLMQAAQLRLLFLHYAKKVLCLKELATKIISLKLKSYLSILLQNMSIILCDAEKKAFTAEVQTQNRKISSKNGIQDTFNNYIKGMNNAWYSNGLHKDIIIIY